MTVATWNVNSIRARLPRVVDWLRRRRPDVLCLQETKTVDADFPRAELEALGYHLEVFGQRTYHGVAIASREAPRAVRCGLPDDPPEADRRLIAAEIGDLRIVDVYVPNGTELGSQRFAEKLRWFRRLRRMLEATAQPTDPLLICGDFNVAPEDRDVHDPERWRGRLLFHPDEHAALRELMDWGLVDAFRRHEAGTGHFTWWDYRSGAFHRGWGLRIDLMLMTGPLAARCRSVTIDREERRGEKPSDHAPVVAELA
jgi:exodeoxyribonuclease-3